MTFLVSNVLALSLSPIFPLLLMIYYFRGLSTIYDYRFIYLSSLLVWGAGKSLSILISVDSYIDSAVAFEYTFLMFFCPLIVLFFKFNINIILIRRKCINKNLYLIVIWFISCFVLFYTKYYNTESNLNFLVENIFRGLPIYLGVSVLLKTEKVNGYVSFFSLCVIVLTIIPYTINTYNRTAILFPFSVLALSILSIKIKQYSNLKISKSKIIIYTLILLLVLYLSDLSKQKNLSIFESLGSSISDVVSSSIIMKSNYLPEENSALNYFNTLENIIEHEYGIILYQFISSITPRIFYPDKPETDISKILFANDISPQPLYFEIFLEPYYDSGVLGVIFYFTLNLFLSYSLFNLIKNNDRYSLFIYAEALYFISLVTLFYSIRGPAVMILQFLGIPMAIFIFQHIFFRRKIKLD